MSEVKEFTIKVKAVPYTGFTKTDCGNCVLETKDGQCLVDIGIATIDPRCFQDQVIYEYADD